MGMLILKNIIGVSVVSLVISEGTLGKTAKKTPDAGMILAKDTTANVEKRLMWLIKAPEEHNPPNGRSNSPQTTPESDILDEPILSDLDEKSMTTSEMPEVELNSHINEMQDHEATLVHLRRLMNNAGEDPTVKPVSFANNPPVANLISTDDEEEGEESQDPKHTPEAPKPAPNPYDPTNHGTSKGGGHKGQHLHYKTVGIHNIPIIRMGEERQENSGFTIIKPWSS
jgi:hypothetical protein